MQLRSFLIFSMLVGLLAEPAAGQSPVGLPSAAAPAEGPAAAEPPDPAEELARARAEVAVELEALARPRPRGARVVDGSRSELLQDLDRTLAEHQDMLAASEVLAQALKDVEAARAAGASAALAEQPPYAMSLLDQQLRLRMAEVRRLEEAGGLLAAMEKDRSDAEASLLAAEQKRRQLKEAFEATGAGAARAQAEGELAQAQLYSRLLAAERDLVVRKLHIARTEADVHQKQLEQQDAVVVWVREHVGSDRAAIAEVLQALDDADLAVTRDLERADRDLEQAQRRLEIAEQRLSATASPSEELRIEAEARRVERDRLKTAGVFLREDQKQLTQARTLWERRQDAVTGRAGQRELGAWIEEAQAQLVTGNRAVKLIRARRNDQEAELALSRERAAADEASRAPTLDWRRAKVRQLEFEAALYEKHTLDMKERLAFGERSLLDLRSAVSSSPLDQLRNQLRRFGGLADFELFAVDDRSVTVGKLFRAALLLVLGLVFASLLTRLLGRLMHRRLNAGAASAVQSLSYYALVVLVVVVSLRIVGIPLAAFTLIGGAVAIGIGFGSQNIVNNFFSGLILMAERPIKVGDLVEVGDVRGTIESIGARSTRIRTADNIHLIVPNSSLLENNVINWTHRDNDIRSRIDVGVSYGSPTRDVDRLLRQVMTDHREVLANPPPVVWFLDFGDNALLFRAVFWIRSRDMGERRRIETDLRFRIDELFREAGIVIAFPQRDVHIFPAGPIPIEIRSPSEPQ